MYKILIIEDKKSEIDSISVLLGRLEADFDFYEVTDCKEALEYIQKNKREPRLSFVFWLMY